MNKEKVASRIDCTLLDPKANEAEYKLMLDKVRSSGFIFRSFCVPMVAIKYLGNHVNDHRLGTVVDFPHGSLDFTSRSRLVEQAIYLGFKEIDIVLPISCFASGDYDEVAWHLRDVVEYAHENKCVLKVIAETGYWDEVKLVAAAKVIYESGADFFKTSTGFEPKVNIEMKAQHIRIVSDILPQLNIKASGGIRTQDDVENLYWAGADVFGISWESALEIVENWE